MSIPAHVKYIAFSILFGIASLNLTRTTLSIIKSSARLDAAKKDVLALEGRQQQLEQEIEYKKTPEFVEEKARNSLNLKKPGEDVFLVQNFEKTIKSRKNSGSTKTQITKKRKDNESAFNMWKELLF